MRKAISLLIAMIVFAGSAVPSLAESKPEKLVKASKEVAKTLEKKHFCYDGGGSGYYVYRELPNYSKKKGKAKQIAGTM